MRIPCIFILLVTCLVHTVLGQAAHRLDSLQTALNNALDPTGQMVLHQALAKALYETDSVAALNHAAQSLELARQQDNAEGIASAAKWLGRFYEDATQLPEAITYYSAAASADATIGNLRGQAHSLAKVAIMHRRQGNTKEALEAYHLSSQLRRKFEDRKGLARNLSAMGLIMRKQGNFLQALEIQEEALELRKAMADTTAMARSYAHIGNLNKDLANHAAALQAYTQGQAAWQALGNAAGQGRALNNIGIVYRNMGKYAKAALAYRQALALKEQLGDTEGMAKLQNNLGVLYRKQGVYALALGAYQASLQLKQSVADSSGMAVSYHNLSLLLLEMGKPAQAASYMQSSLEIKQQLADAPGLATAHLGLGEIKLAQDSLRRAKTHYLIALQGFTALDDQSGVAEAYHALALLFSQQQLYLQAQEYMTIALEKRRALEEDGLVAQSLIGLGEILLARGQAQEAFLHLQEGLALAQQVGYLEFIAQGGQLLTQASASQGKYQEALAAHRIYKKAYDSLQSRENIMQLTRLSMEQEFSYERDSIARLQEAERRTFDETMNKRQRQRRLAAIGLALALAIAFVLFLVIRVRQQTSRKLTQHQHQVIDTREEVQSVNEEIRQINESLAEAVTQAKHQRESLFKNLNLARRLQEQLLPSKAQMAHAFPGYMALLRPQKVVSGDFYWLSSMEVAEQSGGRGKIVLAAADCTGHGVPGAFMSMIGTELLNQIVNARKVSAPDEILSQMHQAVQYALHQAETNNQDGMDMALVVIDPVSRTLEFAGAKNPLIYFQHGQLHQIKGDRHSIGGEGSEQLPQFTRHTITLNTPTTFYLFSDGLQDQFGGPKGKKYMPRRLRECLQALHALPMHQQTQQLEQELDKWMGSHEQVDDILVLGAQV